MDFGPNNWYPEPVPTWNLQTPTIFVPPSPTLVKPLLSPPPTIPTFASHPAAVQILDAFATFQQGMNECFNDYQAGLDKIQEQLQESRRLIQERGRLLQALRSKVPTAAPTPPSGPRYAPEDPTLPSPWRGLIDGSTGSLYYWNTESNHTQYERPCPQALQCPPTLTTSVSSNPPPYTSDSPPLIHPTQPISLHRKQLRVLRRRVSVAATRRQFKATQKPNLLSTVGNDSRTPVNRKKGLWAGTTQNGYVFFMILEEIRQLCVGIEPPNSSTGTLAPPAPDPPPSQLLSDVSEQKEVPHSMAVSTITGELEKPRQPPSLIAAADGSCDDLSKVMISTSDGSYGHSGLSYPTHSHISVATKVVIEIGDVVELYELEDFVPHRSQLLVDELVNSNKPDNNISCQSPPHIGGAYWLSLRFMAIPMSGVKAPQECRASSTIVQIDGISSPTSLDSVVEKEAYMFSVVNLDWRYTTHLELFVMLQAFLSKGLFGDKYGTGDDGVILGFTSDVGSAPVASTLSTLSTAALGCNYKVTSKHRELASNGLWDDSGGLPTMKITLNSLCESCCMLADWEHIHDADHMLAGHECGAIVIGLSHLLLDEEIFSEVTMLRSRWEALLLCPFDVNELMISRGVANFKASVPSWKARLKVSTSSPEGYFEYDWHIANLVESMRINAEHIFVCMQLALSALHCFGLMSSIDIITVMPSFSHAWGFQVDQLGPSLPTSGHFELHLVQKLLAFQRCFLLVTMGFKRLVIVFVGRICKPILQPHMYLSIFTADSTKWTSFRTAVNKCCARDILTRFQAHDLPLLLLKPWFIHLRQLGNSETAKKQPPSCRKALAELNQIIHLMESQIFIPNNPRYFRAALVGNVSREQLRSTASIMDTIAAASCGKRIYSIEIYVWMGSVGISILVCLLTCRSTTFRSEAAREIESLAYCITHHSRYWYVIDVLMHEEGFLFEFFDIPPDKKLDSLVAATTIWFTDDLNTRDITFLKIVYISVLNITGMLYLLQENFSKPHDFEPHAIYQSIRVKDDMVSRCCGDIATIWLSQFPVVQFCILSADAQILGSLVINGICNTLLLVDFLLLLRSSFGGLNLQLDAELVKCEDARDARSMIDLVLWIAVIVWYYMHNGCSLEALELYSDKGWIGLLQHSITTPSVRLACAQLGNMCKGRSVHGCGITLELTVSTVSNILVDLHAKCHIIRDARYIFVTAWDKIVLPWSSSTCGYSLNGFAYEALHLCLRMRSQSFQLAAFTMVSVFSASASCGFLQVYEESCFHGYVAMPNGKPLKAMTCDTSLDGALGGPARTQAQLLNAVVQASHAWLLTSLIPCALLLSIMQVISTIAATLTQLTSAVPRHLNAKTSTHTAALPIVSPEMCNSAQRQLSLEDKSVFEGVELLGP